MKRVSKTDAIDAEKKATRPGNNIPPATILVIDIGGTKAKLLATAQTEPIKFASGKTVDARTTWWNW